jgi:hypothetical protein
MARLYSAALQRELNQLESAHVWSMAFELFIAGTSASFRLVNYDQAIAFHGQVFTPFPVDVDSLEDATSAAIGTLRLTVGNVDQQLSALLENYWAPLSDPEWLVTVWELDCHDPDLTELESGAVYRVAQVTTDWLTAVVELQAEGMALGTVVPKRRYSTSSGFQFIPRR